MPKVFSGLTICVSGAFAGMSQSEVKSMVTKNGGTVSSTCTRSTDYVLAAALGTGKASRAQDLGTPVVGQEWLEASVEDGAISTNPKHYLYEGKGGIKGGKGGSGGAKKKSAAASDDDDDAEDDDDEDDKPKKAKKPAKKVAAKKKKAASDDDEDDEEDDEDDDKHAGSKRKKASDSGSGAGVFKGLTFAVSGKLNRPQATIKTLLAKNGGSLADSVTRAVTHVLAIGLGSSKTMKAARTGLPVVKEEWLDDCVAEGKLLNDDKYYHANSPSGKVGKGGAGGGDDGSGGDDDDDDGPKKKKAKVAKKKKDDDDDDDGDDDDEDDKPKKKAAAKSSGSGGGGSGCGSGMKKVVQKGRVPVDDTCPGAADMHVLEEPGCIWDAMLNQTNLDANNNKFYIVQLLESDSGKTYAIWNRWGRVGARGQNKWVKGISLDAAKRDFRSKFRDKTKNDWDSRHNFKKVSGKYQLLERDLSIGDDAKDDGAAKTAADEDGDDDDEEKSKKAKKKADVESMLLPQVQDLVKLISDVNMMKKQMIEIGFDEKRMPLGKLSKAHIMKGYNVLKQLSDELESKSPLRARIGDLSSEFYTLIPHNVGFARLQPIATKDMLKQKLEMVEALADIEVATKVLNAAGKGDDDIHPVDSAYLKLGCKIQPLDKKQDEFKVIEQYVANTHAATHTTYSLTVEEAFAVERPDEAPRFTAWEKNENRQLLWHGSRLTNFVGILSQGLRIAPPEAPVTGYMFGKGVYFADMVSKSANYCCTNRDSNTGLLLLCEVALGKERPLYGADYYAANLPAGSASTKGVGGTHPDPKGTIVLDNGCKVPAGPGIAQDMPQPTSLLYNEFIVYDVAQIKMRYLVRMKFNYK